MSRIAEHPFLSLLALISAILIVIGRVNKDQSWGTPVFIAGIAVLVIAGLLYVVGARS